MPLTIAKKPSEAVTREEKEKALKFFKEKKGKVVFSKKVRKAKANLKKAKLI